MEPTSNDINQRIGYLTGKIEELEKQIKHQGEQQNDINTKLDKALEQLSLYRHLIIFLRGSLLLIAAIVTLKFGDISTILKEMLK